MKERTLRDLVEDPKIGDFLAREKEIKSWPDCWFDPNDQSKMKIFTKKVETDLPAFIQKIKEKGSLSLDDIRTNRGEVQEEIREVTQDLTLLKKYVGMSYFFLKNKIPFPTMLHKNKKELGLVFSFSLEGQFYNWDEEIALLHPFILSTWKGPIDWPWEAKCRWLQGVGDWLLIIDRYLGKEKQGNSFKKKLLSLLGVDQKVREIMDRAKLNLAELKAVLGINDFFKNASLVERIWASVSDSDSSKVSFTDKALCVIKYYGGASDERGWDVRVDRSTLHLFCQGKSWQKKFPYSYIYEDFPGGQTYHREYNEVKKVLRVKPGDPLEISLEMGDSSQKTISFLMEEGKVLSPEKEKERVVEAIIASHKEKWLSPGNLEPVALSPQPANYPFSVVYQIRDDKAYLSLTKVIDMERYEIKEVLSVALDVQFKVSLWELDLNTEKLFLLSEKTSDRNETFSLFLPIGVIKKKASNFLTFSLPPEIHFEDGKPLVSLKMMKGSGEYKSITF